MGAGAGVGAKCKVTIGREGKRPCGAPAAGQAPRPMPVASCRGRPWGRRGGMGGVAGPIIQSTLLGSTAHCLEC